MNNDKLINEVNKISGITEQLEHIVTDTTNKFSGVENKKLDKNGIVTMANMGQDVKEAMTGGSVAIVGKDTILSENIVDKQVTEDKISFLDTFNLFSKSSSKIGYMIGDSGAELPNADHICSDFIKVSEYCYYYLHGKGNYCFYDINKAKISFYINNNDILELQTPKNCHYIKFSIKGYNTINDLINNIYFCKKDYINECRYYLNDMVGINGNNIHHQSITYDKCNFFCIGKNKYNKNAIIVGKLLDGTNGNIMDYPTHTRSELIEIKRATYYVLNVKCNYAFYTKENIFISGGNNLEKGVPILAPTNAFYICFSMQNNIDNRVSICQIEEGTSVTEYSEYKYVIDNNYLNIDSNNSDLPFKGKVLTTYGDSITELGSWQDYVINRLGFTTHNNCGYGGRKIADQLSTSEYINNIPQNSDVILIMGGTNDCGQGVELGDLSYPYDITKFKSALATTIQRIQDRCPNALIVVMSLLSGRGETSGQNMTKPVYNSIGLTSYDYAIATQEVAHFMSVEFIDVFGKTGINQFNRATYISDTVHPNSEGGKKIARVVVNELKNMNVY